MAERTWQIQINGQDHTLRAQHSYWTGQRTVWLDERVVVSDRKLLEYGSWHSFSIDGQPAAFEIVTNGVVYRYLLWINGEPQPALEDGANLDALRSKVLRNRLSQQAYWNKLAESTGLKVFPRNTEPGLWQQRLIGRLDQYVVLIAYGQQAQTLRPIIGILIRFRPGLDSATTREAIKCDPDLQFFSDKANQRRGYEQTIGDEYAWFMLPYAPKKETAEAVAARVRLFVTVIARHAQPLTECEGGTCKVKNGEPVQLVLINNQPTWLCGTCLVQLPQQISSAQQHYQAAPSGLMRGVLAGAGVAALGALAWAIIEVLFQAVAVVIGAATFAGIVKVMDRVKTKRTLKSLLVASGLAVSSAIVGVYLTAIWEVISNPPISLPQLSVSQWLTAVQHFVAANNRLLGLTIVYCVFGIVPYFFLIRYEQKFAIQQAFEPKVEVVNINF